MVKQSDTDQTGIRARQVPQSVRFLRALGVPATRLAGIFGDSADNIRHIDSRSYIGKPPHVTIPALHKDDLGLLRLSQTEQRAQFRRNIQGIRLRSKYDLERVEASVWAIFENHQSVGMEQGYDALLAMLPSVSNARHGHALKVRLIIEERLAWFALPLDRIETALGHAQRAMNLAVEAFRESAGVQDFLLRYGEAALVASICTQKLHQPERALDFIHAADEANTAVGQIPGSEHLRQRGATFLQMGAAYDELAYRALTRAPKRMLRKNEARQEVDLSMNGLRQRAFLDRAAGWDKGLELVSDVRRVYGSTSMQFGVAAKSAALVGQKFRTPESTETSLMLLREISPENNTARVPHLLSITPELKLAPDELDLWLRFAMNEAPLPPRG